MAAVSLGRYFTALIIAFACATALPARAQEATTTTFGVTVSPVVDEFTSKAGTATTRSIKITNPIQDVVTLYPVALNFSSSSDQGQPAFYSLAERNSKYALTDWISFPRPLVRIAPGEIEEFTYTVTVPEGAEPGGHYGAVLFSTKPPEERKETKDSQVSVVVWWEHWYSILSLAKSGKRLT